MSKAIFITVRSGSSRLPKKALLKINDAATIEHLINHVRKSQKADKIVVCTTVSKNDDEICALAEKSGVNFFRGSIKDKLDRCLKAALHYNIEYFVNVDGDDIFCEPELIDLAFDQYEADNHDFIKSNEKDLVCGAFTFGIKTEALKEICRIKDTDDTEAAWLLFSEISSIKTSMLDNIPEIYCRPEIRATLDYSEDLEFFKAIIDHFHDRNKKQFSLRDIISFIDSNPDVLLINRHRHKDYLENQKKLLKNIGVQ
jgi:spore coat polysaccharide biosynthesis protein SpsF (cytidylyltransferase family)